MAPKKSELVYLKAVEASKFLGLSISDFLQGVRDGTIPKSHFFGVGYRWNLKELEGYKNAHPIRTKTD